MKRKIVLFAALLLMFNAAGQELRDAIAVVRPVYSESSEKFLHDLSKSLLKDGYKVAAQVIESYAEGGFGSGIVYKNEADGKFYIITNRHVAAQAESVTIEFMPAGKPVVRYKNCRIAVIDYKTDLALIELPESAKFEKTLTLYEGQAEEAADVYTAGFPGLGGDPSWQFGKGIVSNSSVQNKEWSITDSIGVIQHTAQIDPGSSGGALLVKQGETYQILGVNTWKVINRENTNFSIPVSFIKQLVAAYNSRTEPTKQSLQDVAKEFSASVDNGYKAVYPFIAHSYIEDITVKKFYELLKNVSEDARKAVGKNFGSGMPIDGVLLGIADVICSNYSKRSLKFQSMENVKNTTADVVFLYGTKPITTVWIVEDGVWKLKGVKSLNMNDLTKNGIVKNFRYKGFFAGYGFPLSKSAKSHYSLSYEYGYNFLIYGYGASFGQYYNFYTSENKITTDTLPIFDLYVKFGLQLPIKFGKIYLLPDANFCFTPWSLGGGYSAGLKAAYKFGEKNYIVLGANYLQMNAFTISDDKSKKRSFLEINLGVTF